MSAGTQSVRQSTGTVITWTIITRGLIIQMYTRYLISIGRKKSWKRNVSNTQTVCVRSESIIGKISRTKKNPHETIHASKNRCRPTFETKMNHSCVSPWDELTQRSNPLNLFIPCVIDWNIQTLNQKKICSFIPKALPTLFNIFFSGSYYPKQSRHGIKCGRPQLYEAIVLHSQTEMQRVNFPNTLVANSASRADYTSSEPSGAFHLVRWRSSKGGNECHAAQRVNTSKTHSRLSEP